MLVSDWRVGISLKNSSLESERFLGLENFKELNTFGLSKTDPDEHARISKDENKIKEVKQKSRFHCKNFVQFFFFTTDFIGRKKFI